MKKIECVLAFLIILFPYALFAESRPRIIFFDVNETLLDLQALKEPVSKALGGRDDLLPLWFSTMLHHSLVSSVIDEYHDFGEIGVAALQMVAEANGIKLNKENARSAIIPTFISLPPHLDVVPGLTKLKEAGYRLATFTNSSQAGITKQLMNAKLDKLLTEKITVDEIKKFKPDLSVYAYGLKRVGVEAKDAMMVAAHGWDIAGIKAAGMKAVFISRPGKVLYPLAQRPDYIVKDLNELAEILSKKSP